MQMIMIIKIVCAIMKLKMLFSKRGLKVFLTNLMTMKMQETKTWLEIQWKSVKAHSPAISATTIAEMAFQAQRSLNFFFLSDRSDCNNHRRPGFSQFECRLNKNQASMVIVKFKCFSFVFFFICTSLLFKNFQLEFASHEILFILDSMPLSK